MWEFCAVEDRATSSLMVVVVITIFGIGWWDGKLNMEIQNEKLHRGSLRAKRSDRSTTAELITLE
jgi:hypothetical protein